MAIAPLWLPMKTAHKVVPCTAHPSFVRGFVPPQDNQLVCTPKGLLCPFKIWLWIDCFSRMFHWAVKSHRLVPGSLLGSISSGWWNTPVLPFLCKQSFSISLYFVRLGFYHSFLLRRYSVSEEKKAGKIIEIIPVNGSRGISLWVHPGWIFMMTF